MGLALARNFRVVSLACSNGFTPEVITREQGLAWPSSAKPSSDWEEKSGWNPMVKAGPDFGLTSHRFSLIALLQRVVESPRQTFLLVEDDPGDVFLMQRACRKAKLINSLQIATDGQMAVDYLAGIGEFGDRTQYPIPCLVFLDLKLPYKHGFDVLKWVRTQS